MTVSRVRNTSCTYLITIEHEIETFTGHPKPLSFATSRSRFAEFDSKITYKVHPGRVPKLTPGDTAFDVESEHRNTMSDLLQEAVSSKSNDVLVLMSDVDEIPSRQAVELIKKCQAPDSIHLQLRNYLYSFEWFVGMGSTSVFRSFSSHLTSL